MHCLQLSSDVREGNLGSCGNEQREHSASNNETTSNTSKGKHGTSDDRREASAAPFVDLPQPEGPIRLTNSSLSYYTPSPTSRLAALLPVVISTEAHVVKRSPCGYSFLEMFCKLQPINSIDGRCSIALDSLYGIFSAKFRFPETELAGGLIH